MALNLDIIGKKNDPYTFTYDEDRVILYALGVGAGLDELDFIYEKNLKVLPTFAVAPLMIGIFKFLNVAKLNLLGMLHGEHKIVLHKEIPVKGAVTTSYICDSIYDKGDKGAVCNVTLETRDEQGDLLFENQAVLFDRTAGNFGGEPGPKAEKILPPEGAAPDFSVDYAVPVGQAALYRLSGDKNPLHIEPEFAQAAGLDRPILHGLCTYGYAGRAVLHNACGGDPSRLKVFAVRFTGMVYPGDTLTVQGWKSEGGRYIIQTKTQDGRVVLGNAYAEVA